MRYTLISLFAAVILAALELSTLAACAPVPTPTPQPTLTPTPNAEATATAQAQAATTAVAATAQAVLAQYTVAAQTRAVEATATAQSFMATMDTLVKSANKAYGPADGALENKRSNSIATLSSGVYLRNFVAESRFFNPADRSIHPWDYGFGLRTSDDKLQYRVIVDSDSHWRHVLVTGINPDQTASITQISSGGLQNFDVAQAGSNHLRLVVQDRSAYFFVNGQYVVTLDVSQRNQPGGVYVGSAFSIKTTFPDMSTRYSNFIVSSLP